MKPLIGQADILRAIQLGACNIYHLCVHNAIHEKSIDILTALLKSAVFVLQAKHYDETGEYLNKKSELLTKLTDSDHLILQASTQDIAPEDFDTVSEQLMVWASQLIH